MYSYYFFLIFITFTKIFNNYCQGSEVTGRRSYDSELTVEKLIEHVLAQ